MPSEDQLRHVHEFSEASDDMPAKNSASSNHSLSPRLISGGLPRIPAKLVKRIQDGLLFVEMAELLIENLISMQYTTDDQSASSKQKSSGITNIMDWVQCLGLFMATISLKEPHRIPDLIGYQNLIMQSSVQCQEGCWVIYDRQFCLKASVVPIPKWSSIDIMVWNMAFLEHPQLETTMSPQNLTLTNLCSRLLLDHLRQAAYVLNRMKVPILNASPLLQV